MGSFVGHFGPREAVLLEKTSAASSVYSVAIEKFEATYPELERLYRMHYGEMRDRLGADGIPIGEYAPRLDRYIAASNEGWLITYVVRMEGKAVGYSNVYLTQDMHNGEFIAQEDTIYIDPAHRNGIGRKLTLFILENVKMRGVKRASVTSSTDMRVGKIWKRMGFKHAAEVMVFVF